MAKALVDFFKERKERSDAESVGVDWNAMRDEWLAALRALYASIEKMLRDSLANGSVVVNREHRTIHETHLGHYEVDDLRLIVGDEQVIFAPKGRVVAGAQGRVDVRGEGGEGMLVVQPGQRWCIVQSLYPNLKIAEWNSRNFQMLLEGVMRP